MWEDGRIGRKVHDPLKFTARHTDLISACQPTRHIVHIESIPDSVIPMGASQSCLPRSQRSRSPQSPQRPESLRRPEIPESPQRPESSDSPHGRAQIPDIRFRVLIIGRANAGKTTILKRVCDTTESPTIYKNRGYSTEEVHHDGLTILPSFVLSYTTQVKLDPSTEVRDKRSCLLSPINSESAWRT